MYSTVTDRGIWIWEVVENEGEEVGRVCQEELWEGEKQKGKEYENESKRRNGIQRIKMTEENEKVYDRNEKFRLNEYERKYEVGVWFEVWRSMRGRNMNRRKREKGVWEGSSRSRRSAVWLEENLSKM
jgi:hypothetical protein